MLTCFQEKIADTKIVSASVKKRLVSHIPCNCEAKPKILVVDDNIFNIVTLQTLLEFQHNLSTDKAMNGLEAVE